MKIDILNPQGNSMALVHLGAHETCVTEGGSMVAMEGHIQVSTTTHQKAGGGILSGIKRKLSGESFFLNHFRCGSHEGKLWLAPSVAGDVVSIDLYDRGIVIQGSSYLCCAESVHIDLQWQGFKSLFSGENVFWIKASGSGLVALNAFGVIYPVDVNGEYVVDTGHIVAFEDTLDFSVTKAGTSWVSSFLGGEGLVCRFSGRGRLWCQSHNPQVYGAALGALLPAIEVEG